MNEKEDARIVVRIEKYGEICEMLWARVTLFSEFCTILLILKKKIAFSLSFSHHHPERPSCPVQFWSKTEDP